MSTAMSFVPKGLMVLGSLMSIKGQLEAGKREEGQAYEEAKLFDIAALQDEARAAEQEEIFRLDVEKLRGKQRAIAGASGISIDSENFNLVDIATMLDANKDIANIKREGAASATTKRIQANTFRDLGKSRRREGQFGAGRTLLTGIHSILSK